MEKRTREYSVLMSVYAKDNPVWLKVAIDSMMKQTMQPNQFVIVIDGPVEKTLNDILTDYESADDRFLILRLSENQGLSHALNLGLNYCLGTYIARMDADDYSVPQRCEVQLDAIINEGLDFVGCNVDEFIDIPDNVVSRVELPEFRSEMVAMAKRRCPVRHPALMLSKKAIHTIGGYDESLINGQDYDLVVRLLMRGFNCKNIQKPLVKMRVSPDFYKRRGGLAYYKKIKRVKSKLYRLGFYSKKDYVIGLVAHGISCVIPNCLREQLYKHVLRS